MVARPGPWTGKQRATLFAGVGSWTLGACDYFVLVSVLDAAADGFGSSVETLSAAVTLTLVARPVGALIFGALAERAGRRPVLLLTIVLFALLELGSALAPNVSTFLALRVLFGIAMGGVWGVAAALTMETVPHRSRGVVSGLFQAGYPLGYLVASTVSGLLVDVVGWRGLLMIGGAPVMLAVFVFFVVDESPLWAAGGHRRQDSSRAFWPAVHRYAPTLIYAAVLVTAFHFFSQATQDIYPAFLEQRRLADDTVSAIAIAYNIAAITGSIVGGALSQRFGRKTILIAFALLTLPSIPLWTFGLGTAALTVGAFLVQFMLHGAWGVMPAYLIELVPNQARVILPGFIYQLGTVLASPNTSLQIWIATQTGSTYGFGLALVTAVVAVTIAVITAFGKETSNTTLQARQAPD